ncbi:MAG: hypothetical protein OQK78_09835, partial [Gammaproteobacteria bacterium]|nr:hypothetical protein [Gammaproteobacteria bacterium]
VIGTKAETVGVMRSEYGDGLRIVLGGSGTGPDATEQMSGGVIGGILDFQNNILRPAQNEIGRIAAVLGESMNELHSSGYDLDGDTGTDLFTISDPGVAASTNNTGSATITASFIRTNNDAYDIDASGTVDAADITQLRDSWQASDYELAFDGADWTLTRLSDNTSEVISNAPNVNANGTFTSSDGFVVDVGVGVANNGDRFLIRPFKQTASDIQVAITNPRDYAAANSFDPSYELEYQGGNDWKITRESDGFSTIITDAGGGGTLTATDATTSGFFDEGFEITVPGAPVIGDTYKIHPFDSSKSDLTTTVTNKSQVVERNVLDTSGWDTYSGGIRVGNNENAIAIASLQTARLVDNGNNTINDAYNQLVSTVGIQANQARVSGKAQEIMLEQSRLKRDAVSGVNLDEEAADLIRYQQAYQAAAKVMAAADQMFKSLMSSF